MIDLRKIILNNAKITPKKEPISGQSVGGMSATMELVSEDLDLQVSFGFHRQQNKNKEVLERMLERLIDDLENNSNS